MSYEDTNIEENKYELVDVSQNVANYPVEFDTMVCYKPNKEYIAGNCSSLPQYILVVSTRPELACERGAKVSKHPVHSRTWVYLL